MKNKILKTLILILIGITIFSCGTKDEKARTDNNVTNNQISHNTSDEKEQKTSDDIKEKKELLKLKNILDTVNKEIKVGDTVKYGVMSYDVKDYVRDIVPMIEWEVLDVEEDKALLITKKILLADKYADKNGNKTNWADSEIRKSCEGTYGYMFSEYEREGIIETEIETNGEKTKDNIFILSLDEFLKYYGDNDKEGMNLKAISIAARNVVKEGLDVRTNEDSEYYGAGSYWLRDNATIDGNAMWVGQYGHLYREGYDKEKLNGIRFSMWVKKSHLTYEKRIKFGSFEQDNIEENGKEDIVWYVLEKKDNKLCLLAKDILFNMQFDDEEKGKKYSYSDSLVRKKLTGDFYENSFSKSEKEVFLDIKYNTPFKKSRSEEKHPDEGKHFTDKIISMSYQELQRYVGHDENYAPPKSRRYEINFTKYAEAGNYSNYMEDPYNMNYVGNSHKAFWLRNVVLSFEYTREGEYIAYISDDRDFSVGARVYYSYGVRPYIELDLNKIKEICNNNAELIEKIKKEEVDASKDNIKVIDNSKYENEKDIILGRNDEKVIGYFYKLLDEKYNLNIDLTRYDIDENKNEVTFFVKSQDYTEKYNKYKGFIKIKYELSENGFPKNEKIIDEYALVNVDNSKNSADRDFVITERNYAITLLKLLNPSYIESYERLPIKKSIVDKYPNYRVTGILSNDEHIENSNEDFNTFTVFATYEKQDRHSETGYEKLETKDGLNEYEIDVVCYDKIVKYKLMVDLKYLDEESYYIEDINYEYVKTINKPSSLTMPKYFLDGSMIVAYFNLNDKYRKVMKDKKVDEQKQKKVTTYKELVAKTNELKENEEKENYRGDLSEMDNMVKDWFYDNREMQSGIIDVGDGLKLGTMKFGRYPQSVGENTKKDIEWYILSNSNGKKLLLSKYILDNKKFSDRNIFSTWEDSTLREWLNKDFYNIAFNDNEKKKILDTEIKSTAYTPEYDVVTKDRVFLLSYEDYEKYFNGLSNASVNPYGSTFATEYAKSIKNGNKTLHVEERLSYASEAYAEGHSCYWLRDRRTKEWGDPSDYVVNVSAIGQVLSERFYDGAYGGVRPLILISDSQNSNSKKSEDKNETEETEDQQKIEGLLYKFLLKLGDKDLYLDVRTNIFTFENGNRVRLGTLIKGLYPSYELNELEEYTKNYYYFDKDRQLLYFIDWSEYYLSENDERYNSLCVIDKDLNKTKIAEKIRNFCVVKDEIVYRYEKKYDIYVYKDGEEKKLDLGEQWFNIQGKNGDDHCYIYKVNKDKTEEWYIYKDSKVTKTTKPTKIKE